MFILRIKRFINDRLVPCSCLGIRRNRDTPILLGYFRPPDTLRKHQAFRDIYSWKGTRLHAVNSRLYTTRTGKGISSSTQRWGSWLIFRWGLFFKQNFDTHLSSIEIDFPFLDRKRSIMKKSHLEVIPVACNRLIIKSENGLAEQEFVPAYTFSVDLFRVTCRLICVRGQLSPMDRSRVYRAFNGRCVPRKNVDLPARW